jgi:uncharacterized repeat protein (TIGR01451 family)
LSSTRRTKKEAGLVTGDGNVRADNIFVTGGLKHTGKGRFQGNIVTGVTPTPDPLALLPEPTPVGPFFGATFVGNHTSVTLNPGTYNGGIHIFDHASVFLEPGTYIINGGGPTVSGSATLRGDGVTIFNGNAHVNLTAPVAGTTQGIVLFQDRLSSAPITVSAAGFHLTGTVYAANALMVISGDGNAFLNGLADESVLASLIVKDLLDSGNNTLTVGAIASGVEGDLAIMKVDDVGGSSIDGTTGTITPGGTITYTIVVSNNGPSNIIGATVTDTFPADITSDTFTAIGTGGATNFTTSGSGSIRDVVNLPAGATTTYTVTANLSDTVTDLSNSAVVGPVAGAVDMDLTNNSATDVDTVTPMVDLTITTTVPTGTTSVPPCGTVTYKIKVKNNGPNNPTCATVADTFGSQFTSDMFTAVGSGGASGFTTSGTGPINDIVDVPVGATITYTVTGHISLTGSGILSNTGAVTAASGEIDTDLTNNSATVTTPLVPAANLTVTKTASGTGPINNTVNMSAGSSVTYTVTARPRP